MFFVTWIDDRDTNGGGGYKRAKTRRRGRLQKKSKEQKGKTGLRVVGGFVCVCSIRARERMRDIHTEDDSCHRE